MAGLLWIGLLWASVTAASELPGLNANEQEVNLRALPQEFTLEHYKVIVRDPTEPRLRQYSGSGGLIYELEIRTRDGETLAVHHPQAIAMWIDDQATAPPAFSLWGTTGVGSFVFCRIERVKATYCYTSCEDFEDAGSGLKRTPAPRRTYACPGEGTLP